MRHKLAGEFGCLSTIALIRRKDVFKMTEGWRRGVVVSVVDRISATFLY